MTNYLNVLDWSRTYGQSGNNTSSGYCDICQKQVSNRTNHKFVHSHVSLCVSWCFATKIALIFVYKRDTTHTGEKVDFINGLKPLYNPFHKYVNKVVIGFVCCLPWHFGLGFVFWLATNTNTSGVIMTITHFALL